MAKKLGKILLLTAAVGSAAAAAYYYMQKKAASQAASEDEDYDNFTEEESEPKSSHSYVSLTPDGKNGAEKENSSSDAASAETEAPKEDAGFTPLSQQLSQTAEATEETVEEFFNEDAEDTVAPEKAE